MSFGLSAGVLDEFSFRLLVLADGGMLRTDGLSFNIALHDPYIFFIHLLR